MNKAEQRKQKILDRGKERLVQIQKVNGNEPININQDIERIGSTVSVSDTPMTEESVDAMIEKQAAEQFNISSIVTSTPDRSSSTTKPSLFSSVAGLAQLASTFIPAASKTKPIDLTRSSLIALVISYCIYTINDPQAQPVVLLLVGYHCVIERRSSSLTLAKNVVFGVLEDLYWIVFAVGVWISIGLVSDRIKAVE